MARIDGRTYKDLRPVEIIPGVNKFAEGSCLIRCGNTHVLCTASVEERVPPHVPYGEGWVTAEYSMLPRANRERSRRDVSKGKLSPRSAEIQRLVGRALRASIDMRALGERTITIDCDVLQGDGGTRTASVTGGYVALTLACQWLVKEGYLLRSPLRTAVAAVSAGIVDDELLLDLCYEEDSNAQVDLNCIMTEQGELVEIQGTGEGRALTIQEQRQLVDLCAKGIDELLAKQREALALALKEARQALTLQKLQTLPETKGNLVLFEDDLDANSLRALANGGMEKCAGICAVFTGSDKTGYRYVMGSKTVDLRAQAKQINTALQGKGGGQPTMIQGSLSADRAAIEAYFA